MKRIAIIDDNAKERFVVKGLVEECGFIVAAEGSNGQEAVEICRAKGPDLVIMDVKMPVKDGVCAASEIWRECPVPVVLLTAIGDEDTVRRAAQAGVMAYLMKPVRLEDLRPAIELALSRFQEFQNLKKENRDLKNAMQERKLIERAKGLLMERERLSENEAFSRIRKISMDKRKTMAEIAEVLIMAFEGKNG